MADTIETFVSKLKTDGVQAGQAAAEKIREEAEQQAREIVRQAEQQAESIVSQAEKKAGDALEKGKDELLLAARDTVLELRDKLTGTVRSVLSGPVEECLSNPEFMTPLIRDIILQYAKADSEHNLEIKVNVSHELCKQLADWAIHELRKNIEASAASLDLKGNRDMPCAGFEYKVSGGTVEITTESVTDAMAELISPQLRDLLDRAMKESNS